MKLHVRYWLSLILVLLSIFYLQQVVFLCYNYKQIAEIDLGLIMQSFPKALKLNVSMLSYSLAIPLLLFVLQLNFKKFFLRKLTIIYFIIIIPIYFIISTAELALYREWGSKLNFKAITYLSDPTEVFKSSSLSFVFLFLVLVFLQSIAFILFLSKLLPVEFKSFTMGRMKIALISIATLIVGAFFIVAGLRGGLQQIPINQSASFYCKHQVLNLAATNSVWNIMHSVLQNKKVTSKNIYAILNSTTAENLVKEMHLTKYDSTLFFLKTSKPNVMFFILEGWAGDAVGACNGDSSITPFFNSLANKGINFERCYASGNRSDQGMAAIFSAFPAQSLTSIIEQPDKFSKLPCITSSFKNKGYYCSYYFGGQLSYANIESYMVFNQMDTIVDVKLLDEIYPQGRLGVHDEYMLQLLETNIPKQKQPFFTSFFTGSTHAPYDIPKSPGKYWGSEMDAYSNSMIYADSCLETFFKRNEKKEWFKNTLFVFVADHSHMTHRPYSYYDMLNHHIPMLFYGDVIKDEFKGMNIKKVVSQTDLAATLLSQLNMEHKEFVWSKNLMNSNCPDFAFYSFPKGGGWITNQNAFSYNYESDKYEWSIINDTTNEKKDLTNFKAYMQVMFQQYLDY